MTKLIDILYYIWLILFVLFLSFIGYSICQTKIEETLVKQIAIKNIALEDKDLLGKEYKHPFVLEGNINSKTTDYALHFYYSVPKEIRTSFEKDNWKLVLTNKDISEEYYNGSVKGYLSGLTVSKEKTIYIAAKRKDIRRAMIHEFGHYFDFNNDMVSLSPEFEEIYKSEKNNLKMRWKIDKHTTSNAQEFFAESFVRFFLYPEELKKICPNTYQYIKELLIN